jgi:hypothetical protein
MSKTVQRYAMPPDGARALFASRIFILILALLVSPAFAASPAAPEAVRGNPRLASLQVEIWPEFDRPAALVILRGEIAADAPLPASVSLRIAAASGGPTAVAYSNGASGNLLNLKYDRKDAGNFITLKFDTPERFFHVEFYDPLATSAPGRSYTYVWTGDLAAERLSVIVQEPAAVSNFSVQPPLNASATGQDGLRYRSAELGASAAGKRVEVKLMYTKTDPRTSTEIIRPNAPDTPPQTVSPSLPVSSSLSDSLPLPAAAPNKMELAMWLLAIVVALGLFIWAALTWWYGRGKVPESAQSPVGFCTKCGAPAAPGARFCSKCGAALK